MLIQGKTKSVSLNKTAARKGKETNREDQNLADITKKNNETTERTTQKIKKRGSPSTRTAKQLTPAIEPDAFMKLGIAEVQRQSLELLSVYYDCYSINIDIVIVSSLKL